MIRPHAIFGALVASIMLVPLLMTQGDIGKPASQVLNPKMLRAMEQPVPDSVAQQLAYLSAQIRQNQEQLKEMLSIARQVAEDTPRISNLEARMTAVEKRETDAEKFQAADPTNIAVLQTKMEGIINVGTWLCAGTGTLILGAAGVLLKRWVTRFKAPEWAQQESNQQTVYRKHMTEGLEAATRAATDAYAEANAVNAKLEIIGVKMKDGKPL